MKIKHIYITKEGEPMANPYMEYPTSPDKYGESPQSFPNQWDAYEHAIKKYHSGLLPFEDSEKVKGEVFFQKTGGLQVDDQLNIAFKPDTLIPVDLEVEVVEQMRVTTPHDWVDRTRPVIKQYRKVLRIKP